MRLTVSERYTRPAVVLHWVVAVLMLANLVIAWSFDSVAKSNLRPLIDMHKSIGITVLGLAMLRLLWRVTHAPPRLPDYARWERVSAHAVHWVLYGLIFLLPLTGWMHDSAWKGAPLHPMRLFYVIPWFRIGAIQNLDPATKEQFHSTMFQIHASLAYVLYAMFAVHVLGALKHQWLDRKPELQRMWFRTTS